MIAPLHVIPKGGFYGMIVVSGVHSVMSLCPFRDFLAEFVPFSCDAGFFSPRQTTSLQL